jgi:hypothetical protein
LFMRIGSTSLMFIHGLQQTAILVRYTPTNRDIMLPHGPGSTQIITQSPT